MQVLNFLSGISEVKAEESKINVTNAVEEGKENAPLTRSATAEKPDENKLQAAPWQDTDTCRVCGVDEDYESIMLCDKCDAEYHTYCLNPPLEKVPEGTWFCPECVALDKGFPGRPSGKDGEVVEPESLEGEEERFSADRNTEDALQTKGESIAESLLKQVELKEYWQLELSEVSISFHLEHHFLFLTLMKMILATFGFEFYGSKYSFLRSYFILCF